MLPMIFIRPHPGEIRNIYIEKTSEALGITIKEGAGAKKGVFVSSVTEHSLANQVGLQASSQSESFIGTWIDQSSSCRLETSSWMSAGSI